MSAFSGGDLKNLCLVGSSGFQIRFEMEKSSHLTPAVFESHADLDCDGRQSDVQTRNVRAKCFQPADLGVTMWDLSPSLAM